MPTIVQTKSKENTTEVFARSEDQVGTQIFEVP
jgi:hypothetical protein